jgi:PspAA-like protein
VIVRIAGEGQFELPDEHAERLNDLDNRVVSAVESGDEAAFQELFGQMLDLIASEGRELDDDELLESDVILPHRDITIAEAQVEFTGEGVIPD